MRNYDLEFARWDRGKKCTARIVSQRNYNMGLLALRPQTFDHIREHTPDSGARQR